MNVYDIALFFHLMGLIAFFGGFVIYVRAGFRLRAATDMEQVRAWLDWSSLVARCSPRAPSFRC